MTLIEILEYASSILKEGATKSNVLFLLVTIHGVDTVTAQIVLDGLEDNGIFRRINMKKVD